MKIRKSILGCGAALMLLAGSANAQAPEAAPEEGGQSKKWLDNVYLGAGVGATVAFADIKQYDLFPVFSYQNELGFGLNAIVGYNISHVFSLEGNLTYVTLHGTKRSSEVYFDGNGIETGLNAKINFSNLFFGGKTDRKFSFSGYLGIGLVGFRSELRKLAAGDDSDPVLAYQGYSNNAGEKDSRTSEAMFPFGLRVGYKLNKNWDLFLNSGMTYVNSDKVDSWISTNPTKDKYTYSSVGVIYNFSSKAWEPDPETQDDLAAIDSLLNKFKDTDGDGVMDDFDKDNSTVEGAVTGGNGKELDTDGDGVLDHADEEKLSPCTEVNENGVALDNDNDGVPNCNDKEPNSEAGCQVDVNGKCISTVGGGSADASTGGVSSGLTSVFFSLNSVSINYKNYPALTEVAQFLKNNPKTNLVVVGHTDASGSDAYNKKLGQQRADAVVSHLVKIYGIDKSRLSAVSKGKAEMIAKGVGTNQNRRVDFLIAK